MLVEHAHPPGRFAREERAFKEAHRWARRAQRHASWALWSSGTGILLAVLALLTG